LRRGIGGVQCVPCGQNKYRQQGLSLDVHQD
jgi:hypothetical protein